MAHEIAANVIICSGKKAVAPAKLCGLAPWVSLRVAQHGAKQDGCQNLCSSRAAPSKTNHLVELNDWVLVGRVAAGTVHEHQK